MEAAVQYLLIGEGPDGITDPAIGGYTCYFPMPFARHCTIMTDSTTENFEYQVNVLQYTDSTPVVTFNPDLNPEELSELKQVNDRFGVPGFQEYGTFSMQSANPVVLDPKQRQLAFN